MPKVRSWPVFFVFVLGSCAGGGSSYAPPRQRVAVSERPLAASFLRMSDDWVEQFIVRDIARGPGQQWRWAGSAPAIRAWVGSETKLKYSIDFTIPDATFKSTGPVTVTFLVNEHAIGTLKCEQPGARHWELPVDAGLLKADSENILGAAVDKVYIAARDGARLGMILTSIGLVR